MSTAASRFYLTTPIYYASGPPHLGHAYTTILGDALCRYQRLRRGADQVFYLTGTDEHGDKIERAAQERGLTAQAFVDEIAGSYREMWRVLHIRYDDFIRTTEPRHERVVQDLWRTLMARDEIYKADYEGLYCVACESFYLEKDLVQPGNLCPDHKRPLERVREQGYFFRLKNYQQRLLDHYAAHPDFIEPAIRMNEVRTFVEGGLRDLSVSRSSFQWGVPVPDDPGHVIYVWIDALANYYSALQGDDPARRAFWGTAAEPLAIHLMGKEITRFHAVYWPAVLLAAGVPLPKKIVAHGWWTVDGEKMSKTLGNVVDPAALSADIGADALRYFLLREVPLGPDGDFSYDALVSRYNSELANDLGNLLNRTLAMVEKFSAGVARRPVGAAGSRLADKAEEVRRKVEGAMEALQPAQALTALFALVREGNTFLEQEAPFTRVKTDPQAACETLYQVLEGLRWLGLMLAPFMPERAAELLRQLGLDPAAAEATGWPTGWGELPDGTAVRKGATLFPRLDPDRQKELLERWRQGRRLAAARDGEEGADKVTSDKAAPDKAAPAASPTPAKAAPEKAAPEKATTDKAAPAEITFDDFKRLDLRAARVLSAERVPKKDRLLRVVVDLGSEQRTVVAGLGEAFAPEALVGRTVAFLANLQPRKIGGVMSQGMILAVGDEKILGLLEPSAPDVPPGTPIR